MRGPASSSIEDYYGFASTYEETEKILNSLGFFEYNKGRTSGSRVEFKKNNKKIQIHKPHPRNILKPYQVKIILNKLKELGEI